MCPDRQLLSVYLDGELPSPWKEKLEAHLAACPVCAARLDEYRRAALALRGGGAEPASPETMEAAKARVWRALAPLGAHQSHRETAPRLWRRPLVLPLPAAAAAALAIALIAALVGGPLLATRNRDQSIARLGSEAQDVIPIADMSGVLSYLESQDSAADIVIIKLPESRSFVPSGEPALVRAADYLRSSAP
jgi:anti-sigma factor RsiW